MAKKKLTIIEQQRNQKAFAEMMSAAGHHLGFGRRNHPVLNQILNALWKFHAECVTKAIISAAENDPTLKANPIRELKNEIKIWKTQRRHFDIDMDNGVLRYSVDLRRADGYLNVLNLFFGNIARLEQELKDAEENTSKIPTTDPGQTNIESNATSGLKESVDVQALAAKLKNIILERGLKKTYIAKSVINIDRGTFARFLKGDASPETVARVLKAYPELAT